MADNEHRPDRKPCGAWREVSPGRLLLDLRVLKARVHLVRRDGRVQYEHGIDGRDDGYGYAEDEDAAKIVTEDAALKLLDEARAVLVTPVLLVGEALARSEVQRGEAVVEYFVPAPPFDGTDRTQVRIDLDGALVGRWPDNAGEEREWDRAYVTPRDMSLPCRLVRLEDADADPGTRASGTRGG